MYNIRQEQMRIYIEDKNVVTIKDLQVLFPEVSLMTIHRDLDVLEATGAVVKFRGGARSVRYAGDPEFNVRMRDNNSGKLLIARKAMELIQPHSSIFLDASTTNLALAKNLPDISLNIFTTGPSIALELCRLHNPVVTLCCGTINRKNLALSGQNTLEMLEKINIDIAFICVNQPYTMTPEQAVAAVKAVAPKIYYPYHYGQVDEPTDVEALAKMLEDVTDVRIRPLA